jgi:hypothetical protein
MRSEQKRTNMDEKENKRNVAQSARLGLCPGVQRVYGSAAFWHFSVGALMVL